MKYVRKGAQIVVDRGITDDADLLTRLERELRVCGHTFTATYGRNKVRLPRLTMVFPAVGEAAGAEMWIDDCFDV